MPMSWAQTIRLTLTLPAARSTSTSAIVATQVPASLRQATPTPLPLGAAPAFQPNFAAAALSVAIILGSARCFRRKARGSAPIRAAMVSIWDSLAKALLLLPGARQAPVAKGWVPSFPV